MTTKIFILLLCRMYGALKIKHEVLSNVDLTTSAENSFNMPSNNPAYNFQPNIFEDYNTTSLYFSRKKEKIIRSILTKTLTSKHSRRKFVEVVPILRALSKTQKLVLATLISSQLTARENTVLNLQQISAFDKTEYILPIVIDIANLVRYAAGSEDFTPLDAKNSSSLEHHKNLPDLKENYHNLLLRSHVINDGLLSDEFKNTLNNISSYIAREKRSTANNDKKHVTQHFGNGMTGFTKGQIDLSEDLIAINFTAALEPNAINTINFTKSSEELPLPESLRGNNFINKYRPTARRRAPYHPRDTFMEIRPSCELFTRSICMRTDDYPTDEIMGSVKRHRSAMTALLAEYRDKKEELFYKEYLKDREHNRSRKEENPDGSMCSSIIRYTRPQKARSATGDWKYIVNTGEHTQTLRLEKCSNPNESCSYLSENYQSRCIQIYNYHRLLSWDRIRGLHVDIFKVPTCCSCHVDGYREVFPPWNTDVSYRNHNKDYRNSQNEDDDKDFISQRLFTNYRPVKEYNKHFSEPNLNRPLGGIEKNNFKPTPLDSFLTPPTSRLNSQYIIKRPSINLDLNYPHYPVNKLTHSDDRIDQVISESNPDKEHIKTELPKYISTFTTTIYPKPMEAWSPLNIDNNKNVNSQENYERINYNYHPIIDFFKELNFTRKGSKRQT